MYSSTKEQAEKICIKELSKIHNIPENVVEENLDKLVTIEEFEQGWTPVATNEFDYHLKILQ